MGSRDQSATEAAARALTEILEQHRFHPDHCCTCGGWGDSGPGANRVAHNHAEHVADAVVQALGLKQESHTYEKFETTAFMGGEGAMAYGGQSTRSLGWRTSTRLVSDRVEQA